jgi:hypothetical protein
MRDHYGMHPVVYHDIANGAVYTTILYTNVNKDKSILMYQHSFILQRCSTTCFDLQEVVIRCTNKNSVLVLKLYLNMDPDYYNLYLITNTTILSKYTLII